MALQKGNPFGAPFVGQNFTSKKETVGVAADPTNGNAPTEGVNGSFPRITLSGSESLIADFKSNTDKSYSSVISINISVQVVGEGSGGVGHPDSIEISDDY